MQRLRLLPLVAAILFFLAGASDARAGQYTLSYDFASDLSGWGGYVEPGYNLCGGGSTAGCPDVTTLRIMARAGGAQAIWSQGRWEWTAPPGTTIVGGALALSHAHAALELLRSRQDAQRRRLGRRPDAAGRAADDRADRPRDRACERLPPGRHLALAHPAAAGLITDAWDDYVTLVHLDVTVADATTPGVAWVDGENLIDGLWHRDDVVAPSPSATTSRASRTSGLPATGSRPAGPLRAPARSISRGRLGVRPGSVCRQRRSATGSTMAPSAAPM